MSTDTTLFAHIALNKLQGQIEDVAVEALGYILSNSPGARRALAETLKEGGIEVGPIDRVETWEIGEEGEIPDLVCFDDSDSKHVLIEAKFWAGLTKNQPNQYVKQLLKDRQDRPAALLFLAPAARLELLWPELCERAKEKFDLTVISESGPVRSASFNSEIHHLQLTSWAALLERMTRESRDDDDSDAKADIRQLRGLTESMDGDTFLSLSSEDLASESARQMLDVAELIDDATYHAKEGGWVDTEGLRAVSKETGYGRFIRIGGVETWFGIHLGGWAQHYDTPLWLSYWKGYHEQLEQAGLTTKQVVIDDRLCIPIPLPTAGQYNAVLNSVVNRLGEFAQRFDSTVSKTLDRVDTDFYREWRQQERGPEFAERMLGMRQLVDDAARRAASQAEKDKTRWANTDGLRLIIQARRSGYGRFIRIGGVKAWFGVHFGGWARHCDTPLWLTFDYSERPKPATVNEKVFKIEGKYCLPIDVPADAENEEALNSVVDRLKEIAERLMVSGA